jgi:hypothetical protein
MKRSSSASASSRSSLCLRTRSTARTQTPRNLAFGRIRNHTKILRGPSFPAHTHTDKYTLQLCEEDVERLRLTTEEHQSLQAGMTDNTKYRRELSKPLALPRRCAGPIDTCISTPACLIHMFDHKNECITSMVPMSSLQMHDWRDWRRTTSLCAPKWGLPNCVRSARSCYR